MPQITPIGGFTNTPVTLSVCVFSAVAAVVVLILALKHLVELELVPLLLVYGHWWRVLVFQLVAGTELDFLLATVLYFHFKVLERHFGLRRYLLVLGVFAFWNAVVTVAALYLGMVLLGLLAKTVSWNFGLPLAFTKTNVFNTVAPGPLGILSLLFICYTKYIPALYHFKIILRNPGPDPDLAALETAPRQPLAITLNDQFAVAIPYLLLVFNHGLASFLPCVVGLLLGHLYTLDLLFFSGRMVPHIVYQAFTRPLSLRWPSWSLVLSRWRGYRSVSLFASPDPLSPPSDISRGASPRDNDDAEVALDEIGTSNAPPSDTPVRPLGRQFLDTFRT